MRFLGENYPTIQTALPYIYLCQNALHDYIRHEQSVELKNAIKRGNFKVSLLGDFQDTLILLGLKKLEKYFPKKLETDWQNYQSYIFAMLLDPRGKHHLLKTLKFDNEAIRDVIRGKKFTTHRYG